MKAFIILILCTGLFIITLSSCRHKNLDNHIDLSVNKLYAEKEGLSTTVTGNNTFSFYLIKEQGDTIYWVNDPSSQEKSELNGYEFGCNASYLSGHNMTLDSPTTKSLKIQLGPNPYNEQRIITIVVMPNNRENGRMDSLKIIQDY